VRFQVGCLANVLCPLRKDMQVRPSKNSLFWLFKFSATRLPPNPGSAILNPEAEALASQGALKIPRIPQSEIWVPRQVAPPCALTPGCKGRPYPLSTSQAKPSSKPHHRNQDTRLQRPEDLARYPPPVSSVRTGDSVPRAAPSRSSDPVRASPAAH
jgi:hypothetical protein